MPRTTVSGSAVLGAAMLLAGCVTAQPEVKRLQALGTEPFWSVEVSGQSLHYVTPELLAGARIAMTSAPEGGGTRYNAVLRGERFSLLVIPGTCSDGMSDTVYPYTATLTIGERTQRGCARLR